MSEPKPYMINSVPWCVGWDDCSGGCADCVPDGVPVAICIPAVRAMAARIEALAEVCEAARIWLDGGQPKPAAVVLRVALAAHDKEADRG